MPAGSGSDAIAGISAAGSAAGSSASGSGCGVAALTQPGGGPAGGCGCRWGGFGSRHRSYLAAAIDKERAALRIARERGRSPSDECQEPLEELTDEASSAELISIRNDTTWLHNGYIRLVPALVPALHVYTRLVHTSCMHTHTRLHADMHSNKCAHSGSRNIDFGNIIFVFICLSLERI